MSIINQVNMAVREIDQIRKSKIEARKKGVKAVHNKKVKKEILKISKQFANYSRREFGVKNLHDLTPQHYTSFLESKSHTTLDYRRGIETHLRLLQEGLNKRAERFNKEKSTFVTEKRLIGPRGRTEGVSDRSLPLADINTLKANTSPNVRNCIGLMHKMGFRVSGATSVKVEDVDFEKNEVSVVEKGGRPRTVPIPEDFKADLKQMMEGKEAGERLIPIRSGSVSNGIKKVADKFGIKKYSGTHAFRHTYARNRVNELMIKQEMELFKKCLANYKQNKDFNYAVRDKELYDSMKNKMDQVHAELGHGKDRFDLALRYMS